MTNADLVKTHNSEAYSELFDLASKFIEEKFPTGVWWNLFFEHGQWFLTVDNLGDDLAPEHYSVVDTSNGIEFEAL